MISSSIFKAVNHRVICILFVIFHNIEVRFTNCLLHFTTIWLTRQIAYPTLTLVLSRSFKIMYWSKEAHTRILVWEIERTWNSYNIIIFRSRLFLNRVMPNFLWRNRVKLLMMTLKRSGICIDFGKAFIRSSLFPR